MEDTELDMIRKRMIERMTANVSGQAQSQDGHPIVLSDGSFDTFIRQNQVAFVDFWAPWCGPCRMVAPVVEKLAAELRGRVAFGKLNVDENPARAGQFNIMSIPTMMIFHGGKPADMIIGAVPASEIRSRLGRFIGG